MSGFALTPRAAPDRRLDLSPLLPSRLAGQTASAVAHVLLAPDIAVGDLFDVRATAAEALVIEAGCDCYDRIGAGQDGGRIIVRGTVGEGAGARMRRGLLIVEGDAGPALAARMIAGTVLVCGTAARRAGLMMRRGTLRLGGVADPLPATFVPAARASDGVFEALLVRLVAPLSSAAARLCAAPADRLVGDAAVAGQGEVLIAR